VFLCEHDGVGCNDIDGAILCLSCINSSVQLDVLKPQSILTHMGAHILHGITPVLRNHVVFVYRHPHNVYSISQKIISFAAPHADALYLSQSRKLVTQLRQSQPRQTHAVMYQFGAPSALNLIQSLQQSGVTTLKNILRFVIRLSIALTMATCGQCQIVSGRHWPTSTAPNRNSQLVVVVTRSSTSVEQFPYLKCIPHV
jgi:hypothetical protein